MTHPLQPCESCGRPACECTPGQVRAAIDAKAVIAACLRTPGAILAITGNHNALLLWVAMMRDAGYDAARARLISIGHRESEIAHVERKAIDAARVAGHPLPKERT